MKAMWIVAALAGAVGVSAQEGTVTLPRNYKVQFENAWVKVTAVHYGPNEKLPGHAHTPNPSAYVYLNDGGPVIFRHVGGSAATRPATKAGAFRVYRGLEEVHEVENTTSVPSEFLRVELKTEGRDPAAFRGKFMRPAAPATDAVVEFDHPQVRISRVWVGAGQRLEITAAEDPSLLIALTSGLDSSAGQHRWLPARGFAEVSNSGALPIDFLRFDLKTRPASPTDRGRVQN
jgi:hypothetical protein